MQTLRRLLLSVYFSIRNSWPVWHGILNLDARRRFAARPPQLNTIQKRIVEDLSRDGIAFTTLDELFPGEATLAKLQTDMESRKHVADKLRKKTFLRPYWDEKDTFDLSNPFFAFSMRPEVLSIINSYDKMWRTFKYMTLNETIPVGDDAPMHSQKWHRDPEEKRQMKTFIYLNDVDSEAGPFTYVRRSQFGSPVYGNTFPQKLPLGVYPPEGAVEKAVDAKDIVSATGNAGTVIFCDTAGLHRGGYAKSKSRKMFTGFYPSARWTEPRSFTPAVALNQLSPEAQYAVSA